MTYVIIAVLGIVVNLSVEAWLRARPTWYDPTPYIREAHRLHAMRRVMRSSLRRRVANVITAAQQRLRHERPPESLVPLQQRSGPASSVPYRGLVAVNIANRAT